MKEKRSVTFNFTSFRRRLRSWYDKHGRDLPWRNTSDPYRVWISEIMLQQTQVVTVLGYYDRFLERFPAVRDLAEADEQEVLRLWEGLGYYRRARQMHRAAAQIMEHHAGKFPSNFDDILALPGIGRYTAGAILSFALNQRHPIVEANTQRLYSRLLALTDDPTSSSSHAQLWQFAEDLLPKKNPGEMNQAVIELGAMICTPRDPDCADCPAMSLCPTFERGLQNEIPASTRKMKYEDRHEVAVVVTKKGKVLIRRCQPGERWAGLWDFPRYHLADEINGQPIGEHLAMRLEGDLGLSICVGELLTTIKHGVTKYRIRLECYAANWQSGRLPRGDYAWVSVGKLSEYPLSVTGRKITELLAS